MSMIQSPTFPVTVMYGEEHATVEVKTMEGLMEMMEEFTMEHGGLIGIRDADGREVKINFSFTVRV